MTCTAGVCGVTFMAGDAPSQVFGNCKRNKCDANGKPTTINDDNNSFDTGNPCEPYVCDMGVSQLQPAAPGMSCPLTGMTMGFCEPSADPAKTGLLVCAQCGPGNSAVCAASGWICVSGKCMPSSCNNLMKDPGETDTDCGGSLCLPCDKGKTCGIPSDCFSHVCIGQKCQAPTCMDNVQNGQETGVDCGGPTCGPCANNSPCAAASDCTSGVCAPSGPGAPNTCLAATCYDGVKNGTRPASTAAPPPTPGMACPPCGP